MSRGRIPANLSPQNVVAVVDSREQLPVSLSLPTVRGTLRTGDYGLRDLPLVAAIERKSEGDLIACVGTERRRFEHEVLRLLAFPVRALVVESTWGRIEAGEWRSRVKPAAALGSLLGWVAMGLPVIMVGSHERACVFISQLLYTAARRRWREARGLLAGVKPEEVAV